MRGALIGWVDRVGCLSFIMKGGVHMVCPTKGRGPTCACKARIRGSDGG